jgi:MATE family multidrug resistance protein
VQGDPALRRRFFRLATPNILSNLLVPLAGLVDVALLGHLGELRHLAGVALGIVLFDYVYWSFGFLRMGTTGWVAQATGRGDDDAARLAALRGLALAALCGSAVLIFKWPLRELGFAALSGSSEVEAAGRAYFNARIWAAPFTLSNFVVLGWLLGRERSNAALVLSAVAHGCNIALDLYFIRSLGWGSGGAGAATALSQAAVFIVAIPILRRDLFRDGWRELLPQLRNWHALRPLLALNRDILLRTVTLVSVFAVFTNLASSMGTTILAACAVMRQVVGLSAYIVDGLAFATESLAGTYHGAAASKDLHRLLWMSVRWSVATGFVFAIAFIAIPKPLFGLLTSHVEVLILIQQWIWWLLPISSIGAAAYAFDGYFLGLTQGATLLRAMFVSAVVGFAPLAALAHWRQDPQLLWLALSLFMVARVITLSYEWKKTSLRTP